jgi:beta-phosphoglucomutase-like phosphatase (HAD superfamily)
MDSDTPIHCNALLFDLDGVLVDSTASIENTWRRWNEIDRSHVNSSAGHVAGRDLHCSEYWSAARQRRNSTAVNPV